MLPWNTGAHKFRHLPCHQPSTPFTFPPPVLPSSGDGVALLSFIKVPPSLYALLSSELFEGVSHSPFPLRGWRDGAAAGGECWPQHRRNSVFIGWWEWFISSVWWWFSALFFFFFLLNSILLYRGYHVYLFARCNFCLKREGTTFLVPSMCQAVSLGHTEIMSVLSLFCSFFCAVMHS